MLKSYDQFTEKLPSQPSTRQLITSLKSFNLLDGEILLYFCQQDSKYQELSTKLQLFLTKFHDLQTLSFQYELSSNINRGIKRKR